MTTFKPMTAEQMKQFKKAARPMMKWLSENKNPHSSVTISTTHAELHDGVHRWNTGEFVKD